MIGTTEALIVAAVLVLLFGARKVPDLARSLGRARSEFNAGSKEPIDSDSE